MTEEPVRVASAAAAPAIARAQEHPSHTHLVFPNLLDTFRSLLSIIVIAIFVLTFVVQPFRIPSESMERTLLVGDFLLVNKSVFGPPGHWSWLLPYEPVRRDDVIVFHFPLDPTSASTGRSRASLSRSLKGPIKTASATSFPLSSTPTQE